jgi:hypothetical protein
MKIFNEKKNRFFNTTHTLLNNSIEGIDRATFDKAFSENGFAEYNYDFVNGLIGKHNLSFEDIQLFEENKNKFYPVIDSKVPIRLTSIEKEWLKSVLQFDGVKMFLNESTIEKLNANLIEEIQIFEEVDSIYDSKIKTIIKAIIESKIITCTYITLYGTVHTESRVIPYKIEYSLRIKSFWLIGYSIDTKTMIKMAVDRIEINALSNYDVDINIKELVEEQKLTEPLVLEIKDQKGSLERALHSFSAYRKNGIYDREKDLHKVNIYYYTFDEYELLKDIISLGCHVKIVEPSSLKEKLLEKTQRQISMFA